MADLKEKVYIGLENINKILEELKKVKEKNSKSIVELAGMGAFLHNFFSGVENILKHVVSAKGISIPDTNTWHRELLILATDNGFITNSTRNKLVNYLAFRHFFVHSYSFSLDEGELNVLVDNVFNTYEIFKEEITAVP